MFGILSLGIIYLLKSPTKPVDDEISVLMPDGEFTRLEIHPIMPSEENLEDSRYD